MYPRTPAHAEGVLTLPGGQSLFWEESGNPDGLPALYLHGGPGGGLGRRGYVRALDPERFRIIGFDQRGCGRSVPLAHEPAHDLASNTTARLIADAEALRAHLGVETWVLNGVSWGSTLALAYATEHPGRVLGVVLMAVTTTRRWEVDWITEGVGALYPEAWDAFASHAEAAGIGFRRGEGRIVDAYARLVGDPDPAVRDAACRAWGAWEDTHISIGTGGSGTGSEPDPRWSDPAFAAPFCTLVAHYWSHDGFLDPPLLERLDALAGIPGHLIHGRLDVSGPVSTAWEVHRRWPGSVLTVVESEGHGGPVMAEAWAAANDALADRVAGR